MAKRYRVTIERNRCKGCALCNHACPRQVLGMAKEINDKGYFFAQVQEQAKCIGCKFCAMTCPEVAITVFQLDENEES